MLETIYKKRGVFKYPKIFQYDNGPESKSDVTKLLESTILTFETQQEHESALTQLLWKPLAKIWQNSCLNPWMSKCFKTLKNDQQFRLKISTELQTR